MNAVDDIAERLVEAAIRGVSLQPEDTPRVTTEAVRAIVNRLDFPAYFRWSASLALVPRSEDILQEYMRFRELDADYIMLLAFAAFRQERTLPSEQVGIVRNILLFREWALEKRREAAKNR